MLHSIDNCSWNVATPLTISFRYLTSASFSPLFQMIEMVQGNFRLSFSVSIRAKNANLKYFCDILDIIYYTTSLTVSLATAKIEDPSEATDAELSENRYCRFHRSRPSQART